MLSLFKKKLAIPIFHMASLARSGETMVLSLLNQHPHIRVVHNLYDPEPAYAEKLFRYLKTSGDSSISSSNKLVRPYNVDEKSIFVLKQGVWQPNETYRGFVLLRNPISIYASLKFYDSSTDWEANWYHNTNRMKRWLGDMDQAVLHQFLGLSDPIEQFVLFYNYRVATLLDQGLPVYRYEDIVDNPQASLDSIFKVLQLDPTLWKPADATREKVVGHGKNEIGASVNTKSLLKYKQRVTREEFACIESKTGEVCTAAGYQLTNYEIVY